MANKTPDTTVAPPKLKPK